MLMAAPADGVASRSPNCVNVNASPKHEADANARTIAAPVIYSRSSRRTSVMSRAPRWNVM